MGTLSGRATVIGNIGKLATGLFFCLLACACLPKAAYAAETNSAEAREAREAQKARVDYNYGDTGSDAAWYIWASTTATTSSCDDHCDTRTEATLVALPSQTAGRIDPANDDDYFGFVLAQASEVAAYTTGTLDTYGALYDSSGQQIATNDDSNFGLDLNFRIQRLLAAGTYYVRVSEFGRDTRGDYTLHLEGTACDDHCDTRAGATLVALSSQTAGRIDPGDDLDFFRFVVSSTSSGRLNIRTTGSLDTQGALQRSDGGAIASDDDAGDGANFRIRQNLPIGTYYVRVTSAGSATGAYTLHIETETSAEPACDDHCDTRSGATLVALPSQTTGRIDPGNDPDFFRFVVSGQSEVHIRTIGGLDTQGALQRSDGGVVASDDDAGEGSNFRIRQNLAAGTYYVRVTSAGSQTGAYTLQLSVEEDGGEQTCDDHCDRRASATLVALPSQTTGQIDPGNDPDFFRFVVSGTSSSRLHIRTTGRLDTQGALQRSDGGAVASDDNAGEGSNFRIRQDLAPGTYYVRVTSAGSRTGTYTLHVEIETDDESACDDHCDTRAEATLVTLPSASAGRIDPADDDDYFRFELSERGEVTAYTTGTLDTYGALYDSSGRQVANNDDGGAGLNFRIQRVLAAGTYYVRVSEFRRDTRGPYTLHLRGGGCDDHCDTRAGATLVALPSQTAGRIDPADDPDLFRFVVSGTSSSRLNISTTGSLDTQGTLQRADGGSVASDDDAGEGANFRIRQNLTAGTYYVRVTSAGRRTGPYTLHIELDIGDGPPPCDDHCDTRAQATQVALPSQTAGRIDPATDDDYLRFEVAERGDVTAYTAGSLDTYGVLYDSAGGEVATDDDGGAGYNFRIQRELAAGTYYVRVSAFARSRTGAYTLHLAGGETCDDHCDTRAGATRVALPSQTTGAINPATDNDYFRFEVSNRDEVRIRTTGGVDTYGALYDSSGREIATDDDSGVRYNFRIQRELTAGTYYVRVSEFGRNETGAYTLQIEVGGEACDDHCSTRAQATQVALPSQTTGRIDPADDEDYFRFELSEGGDVAAYTTGRLDTYGALYDSSGGEVATNDDGGAGYNFRIQRELAAGTYYVRISEFGRDRTGAYTLHLEVEDDEVGCDDHCDARAEATRVALRSQTAGRIDPGNDADFFRFEVSGTSSSRLNIHTTGSLDTRGTLQRSDGGVVASNDNAGDGANFRIRQNLAAGTYYVRVTSAGSLTGAYTLHVEIETDAGPSPCDDHCDTRAEATLVVLPSATAGRVDPATDDDYFRFEVSEPGEVAAYTTGGLDSYGTLYDSAGKQFATDDDSGAGFNFRIQRELAAGTYYVRVSAFGRNRTGAYTLHLQGAGCDDHCDTQAEATQVALPSQTAGQIDPGNDADFFRFVVSATTSGRLNIRTTGGLDTRGALQRSDGGVVASNDNAGDGANFRIRQNLAAGTYYVRVTSVGSLTGAYTLHVEIETDAGPPACDDHCDTQAEATQVALPSQTAGRVDPAADDDYFRFEVSEPGEVAAHTTGGLDSYGTLYDSSGRALATDDDSGASYNFRIQRELAAGTYYIRVSEFGRNETGAYTLHLNVGACDDHCDTPAEATRVAPSSQTAGTIDPANDDDYFSFEVPTRGEVRIRTTGGLDTHGTLYDSSAGRIAANDDGGARYNFRIQRELAAGTYYIRVSEFGRNRTGSYTLHIETGDGPCDDHCNTRSDATLVSLPSETAGRIDPADDDDYFRFEMSERGEVAAYTTSRLDTYGVLYDSSGRALATDDDAGARYNFRIRRELAAGMYYIRVSEFRRNGTGAYILHLSVEGGSGSSLASGGYRTLGDFNGDGRDDLLLRHKDGGWHYYPMGEQRDMPRHGTANLTRSLDWSGAGVGDFNGDGKDDVLLRHADGRWYYYPMDGRRHLDDHGLASLPSDLSWSLAGIGDFDGDAKDDVLLRSQSGRWYFYPMDGRRTGTGRGTANLTQNLEWSLAGVGDFNSDGKDDVLLRHADGRWYYYPMDGRRHMAGLGTASLPSDLSWSVAGIGDFDGNGRDDVLLRHETSGRWHFYPMNGRRAATGGGTPDLTRNLEWSVAGVGDLNGDGKDDLLLRQPATDTWYYYPMNGLRPLSGGAAGNPTPHLDWGGPSKGTTEGG